MDPELRDLLAALKVVNALNDLGDAVYDVRGREMKGWEGPQVVAYGEAVVVVLRILEAHPEIPGYQAVS